MHLGLDALSNQKISDFQGNFSKSKISSILLIFLWEYWTLKQNIGIPIHFVCQRKNFKDKRVSSLEDTDKLNSNLIIFYFRNYCDLRIHFPISIYNGYFSTFHRFSTNCRFGMVKSKPGSSTKGQLISKGLFGFDQKTNEIF